MQSKMTAELTKTAEAASCVKLLILYTLWGLVAPVWHTDNTHTHTEVYTAKYFVTFERMIFKVSIVFRDEFRL